MGILQALFIKNNSNHLKNAAFWNAIAGLISAAQSAIILIFISRNLRITDAGIFTISYAIAILLTTIARYGMRNYQVTDETAHLYFKDYLLTRWITVVITLAALGIYLLFMYHLKDYSFYKVIIILELGLYKMTDAVEDVFLGLYQQRGRLDIAAKIMAFRLMISTFIICAGIAYGLRLEYALGIGFLLSVMMSVIFIKSTFSYFQIPKASGNKKCLELRSTPLNGSLRVKQLFKECFPLCVGMSLAIYVGNVPKYMIDAYMDEKIQAIFGYLMLPVFVILLISNFIYQPIIKSLGDLWNQQKYQEFTKRVFRQYGLIGALTVLVALPGAVIGLPLLSFIYHVDLSSFRQEFIILLFGGGIYALVSFLAVPITIVRRQKSLAYGYVFVSGIAALVLGRFFVVSWGMQGAAVLYLTLNIMLVLFFTFIWRRSVQKQN